MIIISQLPWRNGMSADALINAPLRNWHAAQYPGLDFSSTSSIRPTPISIKSIGSISLGSTERTGLAIIPIRAATLLR